MRLSRTKTINTIMYAVVIIVTFGVYLYHTITTPPVMGYNEIITLPTTGVPMPYWLFIGLSFIVLPAFACLILTAILEKLDRL